MSNHTKNLFYLTKADIKRTSEIAAKAYFKAGEFSILSADPTKRMKYIIKIMKMVFTYTLKYGELYASSENLEGIAAWLPYNKAKIPIWQYIRYGILSVFIKVGNKARKELLTYDKLNKKKHKEFANLPHWYLYNLVVDPEHQGKGWARALLNPMIVRADKDKLPCYLETGERNVTLYEKFGFEVVDRISVPKFDNDIYLMMRYSK